MPVARLAVAELQGQAIVAAAVRADLDQAPQPALQPGELARLVRDGPELRLGGPDNLAGGPGLGGAEQVADLGQREAEPPGPADERQPQRSSSLYSRNPDLPGGGRESRPRRW